MIKVENLSKKYPKSYTKALDNVNFNLEGNQIVGLVGPNGAGKTTLLKAICDIIINYDGNVIKEKNHSIGLVLDDLHAYSKRSLKFNLNYFKMVKGLKDFDNAVKILKQLNFDIELMDKKLSTFSYGMNQKVMTAISLMGNPDIVLLDEPFRGLDIGAIAAFENLLKELKKQGKLIFFSSHNLHDVETICDQVIVMKEGEILDIVNSKVVGKSNNIRFTSTDNKLAMSLLGKYNPKENENEIVLKLEDNLWNEILMILINNGIEVLKVDNSSSLKDRLSSLYEGGYHV